MEGIVNAISALGEGIADIIDGISNIVGGVVNGIGAFFETLFDILGGLLGDIIDIISGIVKGVIDGVTGLFNSLFGVLWDIVSAILEGITDLLKRLFVPDGEYFSSKITDFRSKFKFVDTICEAVDIIGGIFTSPSEFGSLNIDLGDIESDIDYGSGEVNVLDVSWYARYKPYGDTVLSGIMWAVFIFNLWRLLPGIINGASAAVVDTAKIEIERNYKQ